MKISIPIPGILHVRLERQFELAFSFLRIQECYEHSDVSKQNKYFSLENVIENYAADGPTGTFSYLEDWYGYNFPSDAYLNFKKLYRHDYTKREEQLVNSIDFILKNEEDAAVDGQFYIIGTGSDLYFDHEAAHGMWNIYEDYRNDSQKLLKKLPLSYKDAVIKMLKQYGYADNVLEDEMNAYIATSDMRFIKEHVFQYFNETKRMPWSWDRIYPIVENYWNWKEELELPENEHERRIT